MTVAEVAARIELAAPPATAAAWDNVGLQVGDATASVERLLLTLDVTAAVVAEATQVRAELIVAHHPLIFTPLRAVLLGDVVGGLVARLLRAGIALYVAHTNLDAAPELGTTAALAGVLQVEDLVALTEEDGGPYGAVGARPAPVPLGEFAAAAAARLGVDGLTVVGEPQRLVRTVALMPGAGGAGVALAAAAGADVLVCGELGHHDALEAAARGLAVIAAGHYATERPVLASLAGYLRKQCPSVQVLQSQVRTDPTVRAGELTGAGGNIIQ